MAGIKERLIQVVLRGKDLLSPEAKKGKEALNELRTAGAELRKELENAESQSTLAKSLAGLEKDSKRAEAEVERAREKVEALTKALDAEPASKGLEKSLEIAAREARTAERNLDKLKQETIDYTARAKAAGIDTSKLADEEKRLATELDKAKKSVSDNAKATKDLEREQRAAARAAAEQEAKTTTLGKAVSSVEKKVLAYAAAYISVNAAMSLVSSATGFIVNGFKSVFTGASESEQILAQLNAALTSTGNEVGLTADELARMATEMRKTSMLSIEQITEMQVALLTYTDIAKEEFPQALQIAIDQQQRLGIGISQSAELVGMALQSPSKAMVALGRQGFKLEEDQKRLLKQFEDTGKMAEAQAIIMEMLAESYGGSAAAAKYQTFAGLWKGITDTFEDFKSKIADSGSFEHLKGMLDRVGQSLSDLESDGTLANLAEAISGAFVEGLVRVEDFVRGLATVDFKQLANDSAEWLKSFGSQLDDAKLRVKYFFAPFITGFNLVHTGINSIAMFFLALVDTVAAGVQKMGDLMPDMMGGDKIAKEAYKVRATVRGMFDGLAEDILQNNQDIANAWGMATDDFEDNKKREAAAARKAEREKQKALKETEEAAKAAQAEEEAAANAYRLAAIEGKRAIDDMADAMQLIDSTQSVAELEKMRKALLKAYQEGRISQQEFERSTGSLNGKIRELGKAGKDGAKDLSSISGVLNAIDKAANDLDISAARTALTKLYREGKIDADELKKAQQALNAKVAELKPAAETAAKSFKQSQEEQRKEIGKTLEENRRASGEAMEDRRRNGDEIKEQTMQIQSFFDEVLGRARDPLVEMSEKALAAFDALQGLPAAAPKMDYSSVEGLTEALKEARNELNGIRSESALAGSMASGFSKWAVQTLDRSKQIQIAYLNEKMAMQQLIEQYNTGAIGAAKFAKSADEMRKNAELLGEADLSGLTSAIDAAKSKMDQLAQSTRSTLQSLNDELLQLKGTQEEIEAAKMQSRKDDLRQQLVVAQKDGDAEAIRNLRQALNTLAEIEAEKERQLRNQRAEEAKAEAQKAAEEKAKAQPVQQQPAKVIQLQAAGQSVSVGIDNDSDELALLRILEQAGMRTVR